MIKRLICCVLILISLCSVPVYAKDSDIKYWHDYSVSMSYKKDGVLTARFYLEDIEDTGLFGFEVEKFRVYGTSVGVSDVVSVEIADTEEREYGILIEVDITISKDINIEDKCYSCWLDLQLLYEDEEVDIFSLDFKLDYDAEKDRADDNVTIDAGMPTWLFLFWL